MPVSFGTLQKQNQINAKWALDNLLTVFGYR